MPRLPQLTGSLALRCGTVLHCPCCSSIKTLNSAGPCCRGAACSTLLRDRAAVEACQFLLLVRVLQLSCSLCRAVALVVLPLLLLDHCHLIA